jgi:hypothetical protein
MKTIASALVKAQREFGPALKDKANPAFRSKYADLGACLDAVMDALNAAGIFLMQRQHPHEGGVSVETVFVHESGEQMSAGTLTVPAAKQDPQGYGSALTYARRYSLMAACGIAPEDDDGNAAVRAKADAEAKRAAAQRAAWLDDQATKLENCLTAQDLQTTWAAAYKVMKAEQDADAIATLTPIKDRIKAALEVQA